MVSPVTHILQHFLERIMSDVLKEDNGKVSIGDRNISNVIYKCYSQGRAEEEALVESLHTTAFSAEKTKLMTNSAKAIHNLQNFEGGQKMAEGSPR